MQDMRLTLGMPRCTILMNARAGLHKDTLTPEQMRELVNKLGIEAEILETDSEAHMCESIRRLQNGGVERLAVAGGDGTIHAAVQCLACTQTELAIIPQGTRNNFAHALGLPMEPEHALALLREGRVINVDLGKAHGTFFTEAAGVGLFADVLDAYGQANKSFWRGSFAILRIFFAARPKRLRLTIDGQLDAEKAVMCTVANGYRIGAGAPIAPGASVVDGKLDLVILGALSRLEIVRYYREIKQKGNVNLPKIRRMRAREVRIEAAIPLAMHVDDQVVGTTPAAIEVVPEALRVVVKA